MNLYVRKDVYMDLLEKGYGKRDYSRLQKVPVVDKNGHTRMVYKKMSADEIAEKKENKEKERQSVVDSVVKILNEKGIKYRHDKSHQYWGNSDYITPLKPNGDVYVMPDGNVLKMRISDHQYYNFDKRKEQMIRNTEHAKKLIETAIKWDEYKNSDQYRKDLEEGQHIKKEKAERKEKENQERIKKMEEAKEAKENEIKEFMNSVKEPVDWYVENIESAGETIEQASKKFQEAYKAANGKAYKSIPSPMTTSPGMRKVYFALPKGEENPRKNAKKVVL